MIDYLCLLLVGDGVKHQSQCITQQHGGVERDMAESRGSTKLIQEMMRLPVYISMGVTLAQEIIYRCSHSDEYYDISLLVCVTAYFSRYVQIFWRNRLLPSSECTSTMI